MPGIPSIFWDHVCDWGDDCRERIKVLLKLRQKAEIKARQRGMSQWYNGKQLFFFIFMGIWPKSWMVFLMEHLI